MYGPLPKNGIKYRNGQQIVLKNLNTNKETTIKIVMYDSRQGWLGEHIKTKNWEWYRENNEYNPNEVHWEFVKEIKRK